ncbi:MAG: Na+:H+ antiporter, NhaA family [Solirubrobacteraceae bacterium]|nr:Na+:H+ antiporter, NhaA family [Solirubrobacteraceae bacterium]
MVEKDARSAPAHRIVDPLLRFLHDEAAGGVALLVATTVALAWANVAGGGYESLWGHALDLAGGDLRMDLRHWINDALMAIFFFVVGLEIKRELVVGELRDRRAALLPALAALAGVALPALIFLAIAAGGPVSSGWAIPAATDIAFAVGVLALLGPRVSPGAKLFLLTIAIVDDVAAILIIALVYAGELSAAWLVGALCGLACVVGLRRLCVVRIAPYALLGVAVWLAVRESGVHPTIAGVALGLLTPAGEVGGRDVLAILEQRLHAVSAFAIVPLFALANAGVNLGGGVLADAARSRVAWAVGVGLVVGKLLGITGATFLGVRLGVGRLPAGVRRGQVWGLAAVGGIGFTVSLFIAQLAYDDPATVDRAKVGIFAGSVVSGLLGSLLLVVLARRARRPADS